MQIHLSHPEAAAAASSCSSRTSGCQIRFSTRLGARSMAPIGSIPSVPSRSSKLGEDSRSCAGSRSRQSNARIPSPHAPAPVAGQYRVASARAVELVSVAFHREARIAAAFDYQVDAVRAGFHLRSHPIAARNQLLVDLSLELGLAPLDEALGFLSVRDRAACRSGPAARSQVPVRQIGGRAPSAPGTSGRVLGWRRR